MIAPFTDESSLEDSLTSAQRQRRVENIYVCDAPAWYL